MELDVTGITERHDKLKRFPEATKAIDYMNFA